MSAAHGRSEGALSPLGGPARSAGGHTIPMISTANAFAAFIARHDPALGAAALGAVARLAELEALGHSCLDLDAPPPDVASDAGAAGDAAARAFDGAAAYAQLAASRCVACVEPGAADDGADAATPLVLAGRRLYLRRYWHWERRIAARVRARVARVFDIDVAAARATVERLFGGADGATTDGAEPDWQRIACVAALRRALGLITGGPGTGKTYTVARLLLLLDALHRARHGEGARIALAAPTGKAAARLKDSIDSALRTLAPLADALAAELPPARTLHALLGAGTRSRRMRHDAAHPLDVDLVVVDEASMVHLEMMDALLDALPDAARLVLLGDKDQLASVEAGAVLGDLCADAERGRYRPQTAADWERLCGQRPPRELLDDAGPPLAQALVMLRRSRRFGGELGALADAIRRGDAPGAQDLLDSGAALRWYDGARAIAALATDSAGASYAAYLEAARAGPRDGEPHESWAVRVLAAFERFRLLCAVHDGPWGDVAVNDAVEQALAAQGWIAPRQPMYLGRPLIATRNDRDLGVFNGDVGVVLPDPQRRGALRAYFAAGGGVRSVAVARLHAVQTAYAMTVHKSQGSEFEHAVLVLPERAQGLSRELVYTAVTRARQRVSVVGVQRETLAAAIARRVQRASGLRERLDAAD